MLWFGFAATLFFAGGTFVIGLVIPGYSHVRQTVSELGEVGSPGQVAFTALLCLVAACLAIFAVANARTLRESGRSALPAYFVGAMAVSCVGVGIFSYPYALHNVFGLSELIGYQAPLAAALVYRKDSRARSVMTFSIVMYIAVLLTVAINLLAIFRPPDLWAQIKPVFGIVQRSLFASWFIWCAGYALLLIRNRNSRASDH